MNYGSRQRRPSAGFLQAFFFDGVRIAITGANEAPMNVQLPRRMDKAAFLHWVQGRDDRYELDRGRVIMMTGGSGAHWQITFNLAKALDARLDPNKWAVLPEFGVNLELESIRFPDVVVDTAGETARDLTATRPVLIAEILSPASERVDLGDKSAEYLRLPSLAAYLVLAQDRSRRGSGRVRIDALAVNLSLRDVDARVRME
jgi:Uma2 family endonuclease